jgi:3-oxoacyl-[acyl-carrier-protein] synthase II
MARVAVTGAGFYSPIGNDWDEVAGNLERGVNGVRYFADWARYDGLNALIGADVKSFDPPSSFTRKRTRTMGRVSLLATAASEKALRQAGLLDDPVLQSGRVGVSYGSSTGSTDAVTEFGRMIWEESLDRVNGTSYLRMMGHTAPVNIGVFFGLQGRVYTTSSACTSGSQGIGYAYEAIRHGQQDVMIAGGAEELCPTEVAVFDTLYATSTQNDHPERTPRPFDRDRDGLVIGEGACTLVLENLEHAQARGAPILAELVGFGTNSDGRHVTQPSAETMRIAMKLALADAGLDPGDIGYVSAHGTATERGDIAESHATLKMFGERMPISSMKSFMGHTLGACGALESWFAVEMMNRDWFAPTVNLDNPDERCAPLDYIMGEGRRLEMDYVMNNNFAFGGINTSLIFRRWS